MSKTFFHPTYVYWKKRINELIPGKFSVLDYGCGNGILVDLLGVQRFQTYYGLDPSRDAIQVGQAKYKRNKNIMFADMNPPTFPKIGKKDQYDVSIAIGVLQYMTDREIETFLTESRRVLKKGGRLMISTVLDHPIYMTTNMYRFVFPNRYINKKRIVKLLKKLGMKVEQNSEKGIIFGPLISHGLVIPFDAIDHFILGVKGRIGPLGQAIRWITFPLLYLEMFLPINYGYTWYLIAQK